MITGPAVRVLGPVRVRTADGEHAEPPGALPTRLVVALALAGDDGRGVAGLAEDVWPEREPRNPRAALQMLVSRTRAATTAGLVESTPAGYRIRGSDLAIAEQAQEDGAAAALALWRGEPGAGLDPSPIADDLVARAARARRRLLGLEGARLLREGRPAEAVPLLEELVAADPLDGAAARGLMRALDGAGGTDRALAAFARHREALADALGTDPAAETAALNTALLRRADRADAELVGVRASATPLLGRDGDVGDLLAAVPAHRLVSIVGTGGLGKTRLAHEVAAGLAGRFDRIVFTELVGAREEEDVALVVGATVGARTAQAPRRIGDPPAPDLTSRTREALAAGRTLLVLDNCEHVVDAAARLTADLLAAVPSLTVLTTSRVPLLLAGEHVVALSPLPADGAGSALFAARATAARPGVVLDPGTVSRLCARLDGLPLAIELAAARLRSMSLAELDRRLEDRFAVLVGGDRAAPERHRTLFAVIDWSRRLLSAAAEDALARLAVFPDGFTAAGASDLLDRDATEVLTELVDQSLLSFRDGPEPGAGGRYRMLETVREFGLRELSGTDRLAAARAGLDRWALGFARGAEPGLLLGSGIAAARALAAEEESLLAVLRADPHGREPVVLAVYGALVEHWVSRGDFETVLESSAPVLVAAGRSPRDAQERRDVLRALSVLAGVAAASRDARIARVVALLRRALRAGPAERGFWEVMARELLLTRTPDGLAAGVERLTGDADPVVRAFALAMQAQLLENRGETDRGLAVLQQVDALTARQGLRWLQVFGRMSAVSLLSQRGEHRTALDAALALQRDRLLQDTGMDLQQLEWLVAVNRAALGELDEAERAFQRLMTGSAQVAGLEGSDSRAIAQAGLAEVATARGDAAAALAEWDRLLVVSRRASWPWRVLVLAASLAARTHLALPPEALRRDVRRLRGLLLAATRLDPLQVDLPVLGGGVLGLVAVLRQPVPETADRLTGLALAMAARRDFTGLDRVAVTGTAEDATPADAERRAVALLRSPAVREWVWS